MSETEPELRGKVRGLVETCNERRNLATHERAALYSWFSRQLLALLGEPEPADLIDEALDHEEDCPCFGDIVPHSRDCANCTCEHRAVETSAEPESVTLSDTSKKFANRSRGTKLEMSAGEEELDDAPELDLRVVSSGCPKCHSTVPSVRGREGTKSPHDDACDHTWHDVTSANPKWEPGMVLTDNDPSKIGLYRIDKIIDWNVQEHVHLDWTNLRNGSTGTGYFSPKSWQIHRRGPYKCTRCDEVMVWEGNHGLRREHCHHVPAPKPTAEPKRLDPFQGPEWDEMGKVASGPELIGAWDMHVAKCLLDLANEYRRLRKELEAKGGDAK